MAFLCTLEALVGKGSSACSSHVMQPFESQGYWGLMSGINGIFDFVKFIDVSARTRAPVNTLLFKLGELMQFKVHQGFSFASFSPRPLWTFAVDRSTRPRSTK